MAWPPVTRSTATGPPAVGAPRARAAGRGVRRAAAPAHLRADLARPRAPQRTEGGRGLWQWRPTVAEGDRGSAGAVLGMLPGAGGVEYRVLVPPGVDGHVEQLADAGRVRTRRRGRGHRRRYADPDRRRMAGAPAPSGPRADRRRRAAAHRPAGARRGVPAGARAAAPPCPAGSAPARRCCCSRSPSGATADVIVYVGCGERGNEMADVLAELAELTDPRTGRRLAERTVIIANTSNMPMMARESRDLHRRHGRRVLPRHGLSRRRDRRFDIPVGRGAARVRVPVRRAAGRGGLSGLAPVRAGRVLRTGRPGSITLGGAPRRRSPSSARCHPPGGDTTEPVTAQTERFVRGLWSLDRDLAYARHYPAVGLEPARSPATPASSVPGTRATATRTGRRAGPG